MRKIISWIKHNKLSAVLIVLLIGIIFSRVSRNDVSNSSLGYPASAPMVGMMERYDDAATTDKMMKQPASTAQESMQLNSFAPSTSTNRMIIQDSYISLVVQNVQQSQKTIIDKAVQMGGFMVTANLSNPQDAASATITVRIPADKLEETLEAYRKMSVKVVSENLQGQDVTDQYMDIEERMKTLQKTKAKFEEILDKSLQVSDILNVQRELINLQAEIDSLKGQQEYLAKNAEMSKITIYLSTDELSLPYAESGSWRPAVILKEAMRSLLGTLRNFGEALIWMSVYSIVIVPVAVLMYWFWKKSTRTKQMKSKTQTYN